MRSVKEWIGKTDDSSPPARVRVRVFDKHQGRCYVCTVKIRPGMKWDCDHVQALINGGENREANLAPICSSCHRSKTDEDVAEKAAIATIRKKHLGIKSKRSGFLSNRDGPYKAKIGGGFERR